MDYFLPISNDFNAGLFSLLNEIDSYPSKSPNFCPAYVAPAQFQRMARQCQPRRATIHPNWDVRETEHAYELYGELPGVERENINIEFPGHETIVISGHVERNYGTTSNNEAALSTVDEIKSVTEEPAPVTTEPEAKKSRRSSYQATVEDDPEDENNSRPPTPGSSWSELTDSASEAGSHIVSAPATPTRDQEITPAATQQQEQTKQQKQKQQQDQYKYWLRERSIGQFRRVFNFASRIDEDGVTANLSNGILSIVVPKAKLTAPRRIAIS